MPNQPLNNPIGKPNPDNARASLGFSTNLLSQFLQNQQPQQASSQPQETAPQSPTNQETGTDLQAEMQGLETRILDELTTLKKEIKKAQPKDANQELEDLKQELQGILDSND